MAATEHTIINEVIDTPMGFMHDVRCSCGKRVAMTNSIKIAERNAAYHMEVAQSDAQDRREPTIPQRVWDDVVTNNPNMR